MEINTITTDQGQPRNYFDLQSLEELSQSIKQKGVLQPILFTKSPTGKIQLAAGERRLRAAKMAGLRKIPAIFISGNSTEISLIKNLQRENLKPIEEAEALARLMTEHDYTIEDLTHVEHALDHMCDAPNPLASGIGEWLHDGWSHSYPAGHCHRCGVGPGHSGAKTIVAIRTFAGEGE